LFSQFTFETVEIFVSVVGKYVRAEWRSHAITIEAHPGGNSTMYYDSEERGKGQEDNQFN
jgi:hypothetical protein